MSDKKIVGKYIHLLEDVVSKYKGRNFFYTPPCSSMDEELTLIERSELKLKFRNHKNNFSYLSLEDFLTSMDPVTPTKKIINLSDIPLDLLKSEDYGPLGRPNYNKKSDPSLESGIKKRY